MQTYATQRLDSYKARVGTDARLSWVAPVPPRTGGAATDYPTLTVHLPSGAVVVGAASPVSALVTAISDDRRTLTISSDLPEGYAQAGGEAWLVGEQSGEEVQIVSATGSLGVPARTVQLAQALGHEWQREGAALYGRLVLTRYQWTLLASDVTAAVIRDVRCSVDYVALLGASVVAEPRRETFLLHVVHQPFATGLTTQALGQLFRELAGTAAKGGGWSAALQAGEEELVLWVRSQLRERGLTEDDVPAPQSLRLAHAHFAAAAALGLADLDMADRLRERGEQLARVALESIWVDSDQDGEVDDGEIQPIAGNRASDWRASSGLSSSSRRFRIGGSH